MPDFGAISDAITAVTNIIDGMVGLTGSLTGDATLDALDAIGSSFGDAAE